MQNSIVNIILFKPRVNVDKLIFLIGTDCVDERFATRLIESFR
jgi:hypothetical protein